VELTGTKCALEFPRTKWLSSCLIDEQALNERSGCIKAATIASGSDIAAVRNLV